MRKLQLLWVTALMAACGESAPTEIVLNQAPSLVAESSVIGDTMLVVTITARNDGASRIRFTRRFPCGEFIQLFADEARTMPVWDGQGWWNSRAGGCKGIDVDATLDPGATLVLSAGALVSEILGDSLPDAEYHATGLAIIGAPSSTEITSTAGAVTLSRR